MNRAYEIIPGPIRFTWQPAVARTQPMENELGMIWR
jgi:hypothetical protein